MKILVTGGTGYIGSHTVVELHNAGFEVCIVDNLSNSDKNVLQGLETITGKVFEFHQVDLADKNKAEQFFAEHHDFSAVIHFAAYKAVGESVENPLKYYNNNINALLNVLFAMKQHSIPNLVFSSSCTVYGQPDKLPVTEQSPIKKADSPYGNTKQMSEEIISFTVNSDKKISAVALRYFNPIGAHHSAEIGELPLGKPDNLVPFITQTAAGVREQLSVFGDDYNTPDGTAVRDYIHVTDLAQAHVVTVKRLIEHNNKSEFEMFNLGTGKGSSVKEMVETFEAVTGQKLNYKYVERRKGDIEQVWADTSLANEELGWKSRLSIAEALNSAWEWEKKIRTLK
ncbi:MAG: UDP-glucose 4-epimerase GalE [Bacteroidota bacterium]|nr:UDP-glucose 4-epimerase GalE [Bacteroidota bacterium]